MTQCMCKHLASPSLERKKNFKEGWRPYWRGSRPPKFFWSYSLEFWGYMQQMAKNGTF